MTASDRYPATLLVLFSIWFVVLGVAPHYRQDWLLENLLVLLIVPLLIGTYRRLRFSNLAYTGRHTTRIPSSRTMRGPPSSPVAP